MTDLLTPVTRMLAALPLTVHRAWPQALVPLPALSVRVVEDRLLEGGRRHTALGLTLRATTPEEADHLAAQADQLLHAAGWRRAQCRDDAPRDGSCFHKEMRYERALPGDEELTVRVGGADRRVTVLLRQQERPPREHTTLADAVPRWAAGRHPRHTLRVCPLPQDTAAFQQALAQGDTVSTEGERWLVTALTHSNGEAQATLLHTL